MTKIPLLAPAILALCLTLPAPAQDMAWRTAKQLDLTAVEKLVATATKNQEPWVRQPSVLAFKAACFLATGNLNTGTLGKTQSLKTRFHGGEEDFTSATIAVEFKGYADDSKGGERFTLELKRNSDQSWSITQATRSVYGRADAR